ncbi:threonine synthase [[Clostridium] hylemonae DSM 15053]|uniref:Threonine synthase n=2 Tax=[Clostridium] hylemonae TaxID=89153 RepID=C0BZF6_9FIRM|nr:threonine synthase [[Clostridium] hylemonae DSM 15053]
MRKMNLHYKSTRNSNLKAAASEAVLKGLAPDGGLFVPERIPALDIPMDKLKDMSYQETAYEVMKLFLTDFTEEELKDCIGRAYDSKFDTEEIAPLTKVDDTYYLELFHGSTIAFKDMALSILPYLMTTAAKKNNVENEIVILAATSGDTGKAAMAGFADVEGTRIIVFYPKNGVSRVQELQMVTQKGKNVDVVAIHGNFDNAQSGVKEMFENEELAGKLAENGYQFSSANSINIGRLIPQVVYYVYAYAKLLEGEELSEGEKINVVVPTGNFGNILAAYYARQMGVPIDHLVCASNENKVLFDFFRTGTYDRNRDFVLTTSPSMDILISSNLERLIYLVTGEDSEQTAAFMSELKSGGSYTLTEEMKEKLKDFKAGYATQEQTSRQIRHIWDGTGYVLDTHTAVASYVCDEYRKTSGDSGKCLIVSTASPFKFVKSVMTSIDSKYGEEDEFRLLEELKKVSGVEMPRAIADILDADVLHRTECDADKMEVTVKEILNIQ